MSINNILYQEVFNKFIHNIDLTLIHLYSDYLVLTLYIDTSVNVRLSYRFRASLLWMLSSLLKKGPVSVHLLGGKDFLDIDGFFVLGSI